MPVYGYLRAHGYGFQAESDHRQSDCLWCRQAKEVAVSHMRDATLKTTKSTKYEPDDTPHTVHLKRQGRSHGPAMYSEHPLYTGLFRSTLGAQPLATTINFVDAEGKFGVSGTYVRTEEKRPVVLSLDESEAALLLRLLDREEDAQITEGDANYQNGSGYERQCVENRIAAKRAEDLADRLRDTLSEYLDKAYGGELGA
jgi:hypothetical protein